MIIGLILAGTGFGAAAAFGAVLLGYPIWMALLIYSAAGVAAVLGFAALAIARHPDPQDSGASARPYALVGPEGG
jgi:membrane protein implicated in regulation of membrane protease activity